MSSINSSFSSSSSTPLFKVTYIAGTAAGEGKTAEDLIVYIARVSNPQNQEKYETGAKLLSYCIKHHHWSIFEQADMTVEIQTSRAISAQLLRHRSFTFQEFSQRYAQVQDHYSYNPRQQDSSNRQNSIDSLSEENRDWFKSKESTLWNETSKVYQEAIDRGIAKECARMLLPMSSKTVVYMKGNIRSWIHFLAVRQDHTAQKEMQDIANEIAVIFAERFPVINAAIKVL